MLHNLPCLLLLWKCGPASTKDKPSHLCPGIHLMLHPKTWFPTVTPSFNCNVNSFPRAHFHQHSNVLYKNNLEKIASITCTFESIQPIFWFYYSAKSTSVRSPAAILHNIVLGYVFFLTAFLSHSHLLFSPLLTNLSDVGVPGSRPKFSNISLPCF